jgi:glycosyltransferase involved in cell wall biosynthesis
MRVLMITQKLDPQDMLLAFTMGWIERIAARVEHLHVLCLEQRTQDLPANVTAWSMGKEGGNSRIQELRAFYSALGKVIRDVDVIFVHMIPRYAILSAPFAAIYRKPQILWYTHRQINLELRLAVQFCKTITTAVPSSFPLPTPKLRALGHGIDTDFFVPEPACIPDQPPLIVQVARLMPIKHQETLLRAAAALQSDFQLALVGAVPSGQDQNYLVILQNLAAELGIADRVTFTGGLAPSAVRDLYRRASAAVNLSPVGLFDKAALESMLVGLPTIVSNPAFDLVLGDQVKALRIASPDDVQGLTVALQGLLAQSAAERDQIAVGLRERTTAAHGLDRLMDRLVALMAQQ